MRFRNCTIAFLVTFAAVATTSTPLDAQGRLRGTARLGAESGGDRVLEFEYADGSTPEVIAGGGMVLTAGGVLDVFRAGGHGVDAQVNVGIKYRTIPPATNQEATWLRFPVEALVYYRAPAGFRLGAGPTVHLANSLKVSGEAANGSVEFDAKPGMLLQAELVRSQFAFDVRYTALEYQASASGERVNASSIGAGLTYFFGRRKPTMTAPSPSEGQ